MVSPKIHRIFQQALISILEVSYTGNYNKYCHLVKPRLSLEHHPHMFQHVAKHFRKHYSGTLIAAGNYTPESGKEVLENGYADLVAFGRLFIANPDLPERIAENASLNIPDTETFYTPEPEGYIDYPFI